MARTCTLCAHPDRAAVERQIVAQAPYRNIAKQSGCSIAAIHRHLPHVLKALTDEKAERDAAQALDVIAQLRAVNVTTLAILREARDEGKAGMALFAIDRLQKQIELQARLLGLLDDRAKVDVTVAASITVSGEWIALRTALLRALAPVPEAREAVTRAIAQVAA